MLLDPLVLNAGSTAQALVPTGAITRSFSRLADGRYIGANIGTLAEPQFFELTNRMNFNGTSTITLKTRQQKIVPAINGVPQKNDEIVISMQVLLPHRSFTSAHVFDHAFRVYNVLAGYIDEVLRGGR